MAERSRAVAKRDFYEKDTFFITVPVISNIMLIMISSYIQAIKKRLPISEVLFATGWNRTNDIRIFSPALYQLSYCGVMFGNIYQTRICVNMQNTRSENIYDTDPFILYITLFP